MKNIEKIQKEWNEKGTEYAQAVNEMVAYGEAHGWDNWEGDDPEDKRGHLADSVFKLLKEANENGTVEEFRKNFPPSHEPFIKFYEKKALSIEQMCFIDGQKIIFIVPISEQKRQAYLLNGEEITVLDESILAVGKSKKENVFAILTEGKITITKGWQGEIISTFNLKETKNINPTGLIPFNDGSRVLFISSDGIYIISEDKEQLIHPEFDPDDEDWSSYLSMENGTLSNDNQYIIVAEQMTTHRVLNSKGEQIGDIGQQSEYPHFCLFSADDEQVIVNSCHFYNGITIGVDTEKLDGAEIPEYGEDPSLFTPIDDEMRVYCGVATSDYYILGDAYGYIRAINKKGELLWRHFLGSTISGMTISDDGQTLWVGSYSGFLHKLQLGKEVRDTHTIGTGKLYEEIRILFWRNEPILKW